MGTYLQIKTLVMHNNLFTLVFFINSVNYWTYSCMLLECSKLVLAPWYLNPNQGSILRLTSKYDISYWSFGIWGRLRRGTFVFINTMWKWLSVSKRLLPCEWNDHRHAPITALAMMFVDLMLHARCMNK